MEFLTALPSYCGNGDLHLLDDRRNGVGNSFLVLNVFGEIKGNCHFVMDVTAIDPEVEPDVVANDKARALIMVEIILTFADDECAIAKRPPEDRLGDALDVGIVSENADRHGWQFLRVFTAMHANSSSSFCR